MREEIEEKKLPIYMQSKFKQSRKKKVVDENNLNTN